MPSIATFLAIFATLVLTLLPHHWWVDCCSWPTCAFQGGNPLCCIESSNRFTCSYISCKFSGGLLLTWPWIMTELAIISSMSICDSTTKTGTSFHQLFSCVLPCASWNVSLPHFVFETSVYSGAHRWMGTGGTPMHCPLPNIISHWTFVLPLKTKKKCITGWKSWPPLPVF
jgi:hypothetical protein